MARSACVRQSYRCRVWISAARGPWRGDRLFENRRGHIIDRQDEIVPSKILLVGKKLLHLSAAGLAREEQRRDDRDEDQGIGDDLIEQLLILLAPDRFRRYPGKC
jgi:hypothetical protein